MRCATPPACARSTRCTSWIGSAFTSTRPRSRAAIRRASCRWTTNTPGTRQGFITAALNLRQGAPLIRLGAIATADPGSFVVLGFGYVSSRRPGHVPPPHRCQRRGCGRPGREGALLVRLPRRPAPVVAVCGGANQPQGSRMAPQARTAAHGWICHCPSPPFSSNIRLGKSMLKVIARQKPWSFGSAS